MKYNSLEELENDAVSKGLGSLFYNALDLTIEEERGYLKRRGKNTRAARKMAEDDIMRWIEIADEDDEFTDKEGIKYNAYRFFRPSYLMIVALMHLLKD